MYLIRGVYLKYIKNSSNSIAEKNLMKGTENTFSHRRHAAGQQVYDRVLNITSQQENANQKHN